MRAVLLVLILGIVAIVAAIATGFLDINQIRGAKAPEVATTRNGISAKGGQVPSFAVETGSVKVGTSEANVMVPKVTVGKENRQISVPKVEIRPADQQGNKSTQ
jgi:hypothetical protein